jgi:hypothetical protein
MSVKQEAGVGIPGIRYRYVGCSRNPGHQLSRKLMKESRISVIGRLAAVGIPGCQLSRKLV